jgi:glycosyltransferase involved in cell wall biosynthesis
MMARILIVTFGLTPHNTRLMPWRTVLEVAGGLRTNGHEVTVLSVVDKGIPIFNESSSHILTILRQEVVNTPPELDSLLKEQEFDVLFIPVSWSRNRTMRKLLSGIDGLRIAYLPGSVFEFKHLRPVLGKMPLRKLLPYLAQAMFPTVWLQRSLTALDIRAVITNSNYSRRFLSKRINLPTVAIGPGRDSVCPTPAVVSAEPSYFLFVGPPLPIRGVFVLLDAYLKVADDPRMQPLLCLFRADSHLDMLTLRAEIESRWSHEKLHFVWETLELDVLQSHIEKSIAVVLPFLIVPSEIPLAVYEAAAMGKTVITTGPHGTGDFVETFGETVRAGCADDLAAALLRTASKTKTGFSTVNKKALEAHRGLENWQSIADRWEALAVKLGMTVK